MKYGVLFCMIVLFSLFALPRVAFASYTLPYPSYMPGNKMYRITRLIDRVKAPFYFGNLSSFRYHLMLSDKYLVEAKTLFEYKQYLLAVDALNRSDTEFAKVPQYLQKARKEGKDIREFESLYSEGAQEHIRVLKSLLVTTPESFEWSPEKVAPTTLSLYDTITASVALRGIGVENMR